MLIRLKLLSASVLPLLLLVFSGCALQQTSTRSASTSAASPALMSGKVHGGQQSIAFATVQIWTAGTTGYGSQGQLMATTSTADDNGGSFQFYKAADTDTPYPNTGNTWACPASGPAPLIYLTARGGNTQGTHISSASNTAATFLIAAGSCDLLDTSSFFTLNEITTVASLAPLTPYFNPVTEAIGSPNTTLAQTGIYNAFTNASSLANLSTGLPVATVNLNETYTIVESTKIITLADILASCVNVASLPASTCTTLFTNAVPPSPSTTSQPAATFSTATDVLQALWYMLANPSDGSSIRLASLFGLVTANAPFQPAAKVTPSDWTVAITIYPDPKSTNYFLNSPNQISIAPGGNPIVVDTGGTFSGYFGIDDHGAIGSAQATSGTSAEVRTVTYDTRNYLWIAFDAIPQLLAKTLNGTITWTTIANPWIVAADPSGNIFYITRAGVLYRILNSTVVAAGNTGNQPANTSQIVGSVPGIAKTMVTDASGNLWIVCGDGNLYEVTSPAGPAHLFTSALFIGTNFPDSLSALAVEASGSVLLPYNPAGTAQKLGRISGSPALGYSLTQLTGSFGNNGTTIDGAGNIFLSNEATLNINGVNSGYEFALSKSGSLLLSSNGIVKPANSSEFSSTLIQNTPVLGPSNSAAVDISGNLWVINSFQNRFNAVDGPQYTITELVGAAVPVVPISIGIATNTIGSKP